LLSYFISSNSKSFEIKYFNLYVYPIFITFNYLNEKAFEPLTFDCRSYVDFFLIIHSKQVFSMEQFYFLFLKRLRITDAQSIDFLRNSAKNMKQLYLFHCSKFELDQQKLQKDNTSTFISSISIKFYSWFSLITRIKQFNVCHWKNREVFLYTKTLVK